MHKKFSELPPQKQEMILKGFEEDISRFLLFGKLVTLMGLLLKKSPLVSKEMRHRIQDILQKVDMFASHFRKISHRHPSVEEPDIDDDRLMDIAQMSEFLYSCTDTAARNAVNIVTMEEWRKNMISRIMQELRNNPSLSVEECYKKVFK